MKILRHVRIAVFIAAFAAPAAGQSLEAEVRAMRLELDRLRGEVDQLRRQLADRLAPRPLTAEPAAQGDQPRPAAEVLPMLEAAVAEHAQTKVESNSKLPVKLFGTIVSNTFYNTGEANWLDIPNVVAAQPQGLPRGSFSSSLRQSRIGAIVDGPALGPWKASGFVALDFFGGIANFQTGQTIAIPRLLYAFMRLEREHTAIEVGQDHMILAPRNPTSLAAMAFPDLYRSGNLYLRAPQARLEHSVAAGRFGQLQLSGGILAPIGGDFAAAALQFVPPALAGERSRQPAFQGRIGWSGGGERSGWELGLSGHSGRERYVTGSVKSWAGALDFDARAGRLGLGGEWFVGRNIDAFGGALGQNAKSAGGYVEARLAATRRLDFNAGYGTDRLRRPFTLTAPLARNESVFANTIFRLTPELQTSFEYRWLSTRASARDQRNNHFNVSLAYSF